MQKHFSMLAFVLLVACPQNPPPAGSISGVVSSSPDLGSGTQHKRVTPPLEDVIPGEIIVKFKAGARTQSLGTLGVNGTTLEATSNLPFAAKVFRAKTLTATQTLTLAQTLESRPDVEYAVANIRMHLDRTPNDEKYKYQWHYAAMNLPLAWDTLTSSSAVVAVVDSGVVAHPDLTGRLLPGYDFISDPNASDDGDGRDPDPTDVSGDASGFHGTHVAGTVGANTNNGTGVAGVNWGARIVPVRALGNTGSMDDILCGVAWAAGLDVTTSCGAPINPNPAKVINMSLGGNRSCTQAEQDVYDQVAARGVIVVVSAGNDDKDAREKSPASCNNVITIGATGPDNRRAYYSNYGPAVEVMFPGGNLRLSVQVGNETISGGVLSTLQDKTTGNFIYEYYQGTSMSAPHAAGLVSLMAGQDPNLSLSQAISKLQASARAMDAAACIRSSGADCGAGLIDAALALQTTGGPPPPPSPTPPPPTQPVRAYTAAFFYTCDSNDDLPLEDCVDLNRSDITEFVMRKTIDNYRINRLTPGDYLVAAFVDLNRSGELDTGDVLGIHPRLASVVSGSNRANINIQMRAVSDSDFAKSNAAPHPPNPSPLARILRALPSFP